MLSLHGGGKVRQGGPGTPPPARPGGKPGLRGRALTPGPRPFPSRSRVAGLSAVSGRRRRGGARRGRSGTRCGCWRSCGCGGPGTGAAARPGPGSSSTRWPRPATARNKARGPGSARLGSARLSPHPRPAGHGGGRLSRAGCSAGLVTHAPVGGAGAGGGARAGRDRPRDPPDRPGTGGGLPPPVAAAGRDAPPGRAAAAAAPAAARRRPGPEPRAPRARLPPHPLHGDAARLRVVPRVPSAARLRGALRVQRLPLAPRRAGGSRAQRHFRFALLHHRAPRQGAGAAAVPGWRARGAGDVHSQGLSVRHVPPVPLLTLLRGGAENPGSGLPAPPPRAGGNPGVWAPSTAQPTPHTSKLEKWG